MPKCDACGEGTNMPYTCNYCGQEHCKKHQLPENHNCPNIAEANTLGPELRREYQTVPSTSKSKLEDKRVWITVAVVLVGLLTVLLLL
ncbi:AN1-type zinc finger protein [Natrarchaeobaculum aegyptiacum]|uniref:AN1-type domain-containing protein n=1 Tax=Natrarchaeobaculum aegyptiacum TaxID=745377 RepID=A0A2Z2HWG2_9EURY|nr:AN1-type zinc finger protein [Natrarchaeobaculum aegyptiacum]ARS89937.1 hypothetical protein B1756_09485 [Natrarchaeobaculum aegyptiacum]